VAGIERVGLRRVCEQVAEVEVGRGQTGAGLVNPVSADDLEQRAGRRDSPLPVVIDRVVSTNALSVLSMLTEDMVNAAAGLSPLISLHTVPLVAVEPLLVFQRRWSVVAQYSVSAFTGLAATMLTLRLLTPKS
jgi:hypothetical protein